MKLVFDILDEEIKKITPKTEAKIDYWKDFRNGFQMVLFLDNKKVIHCIYADYEEFVKYTYNILAKLEGAGINIKALVPKK